MNKLTKDNEKKIDKVLKKINKITFSNADELNDFNKEFKSNLSLKIFDLEKEGNNQSLATNIVIKELINEKKSLKKEMKNLFNILYSKPILYLSSIGIVISSIIMAFTLIFSYLNLFNEEDIYTFKLGLIVLAISIVLFVIWEIINLIKVKRTLNFISKIMPINLSGVTILILLVASYKGGPNPITGLLVYLLSFSIPVFTYLLIKK